MSNPSNEINISPPSSSSSSSESSPSIHQFDSFKENYQHFQPIYTMGNLRISGIYSNYLVERFDSICAPFKNNLLASSADGKFLFFSIWTDIHVYLAPDFSSKTPPDPNTIFPFSPYKILKMTIQQRQQIYSRPGSHSEVVLEFNQIRVGRIGAQESLIAVGSLGIVLIWDLSDLEKDPILLEILDFESVWGIATSAKNNLIAVSSNSHKVTIIHYPSRRIIFSKEKESSDHHGLDLDFKIHTHNIPSLDFSPCGHWLVSCAIDGKIVLWSIQDQNILKMDSKSSEWGWLVRFVSPNQYDTSKVKSASEIGNDQIVKSYYQTCIENASEVSDFEAEIFPTAFYDDIVALEDEVDFLSSDGDDSDYEFEVNDSNDQALNDLVLRSYIPQLLPVSNDFDSNNLEGQYHLAEGIGENQDTWPVYSDDDGPEGFSDYTNDSDFYSDDDIDYGIDYDIVEAQDRRNASVRESENLLEILLENSRNARIIGATTTSGPESSDSTNSNTTSDSSVLIDHFETSSFRISFQDTEGISLFLDGNNNNTEKKNISKLCPYDLLYCTASSFFIVDPSGTVKSHCPNVRQRCLEFQRSETLDEVFGLDALQILQNRLAMGEWISELEAFLVIDCSGHLLVVVPKSVDDSSSSTSKTLVPRNIVVPDSIFSRTSIIGFTVIKKLDEEFGVKVHVYIICFDGTVRLYEICKTL